MKIIFAGTPEFAAVALQSLHEAGFEIPLVLTQPDRPAGRGMQLRASAVKQYALSKGMSVAQPRSLRLDGKFASIASDAHGMLRATPHDVMVVAAYGLILPASVLTIPRLGCLNIHASLLPRWRGAAPIHRAIEAGDTTTGITIMQMDEGLDTGPMLLSEAVDILPEDTTGSLHDRLAPCGGSLIVRALQQLQEGVLDPTPQPAEGSIYAAKISKDEALLDFALSAEVLARKIRAYNPAPGAFATIADQTVKIWRAEAITRTETAPIGHLVSTSRPGELVIACGSGALRLIELQKPGGKRLSAVNFTQTLLRPSDLPGQGGEIR